MEKILNDILKSSNLPEGEVWSYKNYMINDVVVKEGDNGDSFYYVIEGELQVSRGVTLNENKHIQSGIASIKAGSIFGESCLHKSLTRISTVTAIKNTKLLEVKGTQFSQFLDKNPTLGYLFYKELYMILIKRLNTANHTLETLMAWGIKAHEIDRYL